MSTVKSNIEIIGQAVIDGIKVSNKFNTPTLSVSELWDCSLDYLDNLYKGISKSINDLKGESLSLAKGKNNALASKLQRQADLIEAIYSEKDSIEKAKRDAEKIREENKAKLAVLRHAKDKIALDKIAAMTEEQIAEEIAKIEGTSAVVN